MKTQDWIFMAIFAFQMICAIIMFFVWQAREERKALEKKEEEEAQKQEQAHECKCGGCCHSNVQTEQTPSVRLSEVLESIPREPIQSQSPYHGGATGERVCTAKPLQFPRGTIFTFGDISDK